MSLFAKNLIDRIFSIQNDVDFEQCALEVYTFQRQYVPVYKYFVDLLGKPEPNSLQEIPFLPISFFKSHEIIVEDKSAQTVFRSSGTTDSIRSKHSVADTELYKKSFTKTYISQIGNPKDQIICALLPNYVEQGESSLVYMVEHLIQLSDNKLSGFYLSNPTELLEIVSTAKALNKQVVIFGVAYALLDLAEHKPDLSSVIIIETGGMKGRRKELTKNELHTLLREAFQSNTIHSEYGMCELLSQGYSNSDGLFELPAWMKVCVRDVNDPFSMLDSTKTGGLNVVDLANIYSCSFISTQDLGRIVSGKLELMGRFDHADIRGCNLMVG